MAILIGDCTSSERIAVNYQFDPNDKTFKTIIVPGDIPDLWRAYRR